ncbi:MAG: tetratricopeptide repeat protein [Deltaproteobacteria bacterium]|nr:tetratricopeptide repeat protein [Deltaproteobacteria bacterium]
MATPRAVVIPFGVPDDGRGLGLGLAALVHSFAQIDGESVALAQLLARKAAPAAPRREVDDDDDRDDDDHAHARGEGEGEGDVRDDADGDGGEGDDEGAEMHDDRDHVLALPNEEPAPVEAFVPPRAWRDLTGSSADPNGVSYVVTGAFEPPTDGRGLIQLLVFETKDGKTRAKVEAAVDGENAGRTLLEALDQLWSQLDVTSELGTVRDIGDLSWEALESVLRAERCALHDPLRGGPHDRLAAMVHLGRAIGDAPDSHFPASRLAAIALDVAAFASADPKLADAALRALERATDDAPGNADLVEAIAALTLRLGRHEEAERRAEEAIALDPDRARLYALLSEARRARGNLAGALEAIEDGLLHGADDPLLNTERGIVLAERGNPNEAEQAWRMVLDQRPLYPPAFTSLASLVMERRDAVAAARLVDDALALGPAHPDVLKRAIHLSLAVEPDGIARAARVGKLAHALVERTPNDAWATLVLARALVQTGDKLAAARRFSAVEDMAPGSSLASEAQRARFALEDPRASTEVDAILRAAYQAPLEDLDTISSRARGLALVHNTWCAWFAIGIAERRLERWRSARDAFREALRVAPGCTPAHMEIVGAHVALGEPGAALEHARKACELDGDTARTLAVLATALLAAGSRDEAASTIERALALDATDEANRALAERIRSGRPSTLTRLRDTLARWRRR